MIDSHTHLCITTNQDLFSQTFLSKQIYPTWLYFQQFSQKGSKIYLKHLPLSALSSMTLSRTVYFSSHPLTTASTAHLKTVSDNTVTCLHQSRKHGRFALVLGVEGNEVCNNTSTGILSALKVGDSKNHKKKEDRVMCKENVSGLVSFTCYRLILLIIQTPRIKCNSL